MRGIYKFGTNEEDSTKRHHVLACNLGELNHDRKEWRSLLPNITNV